MNTKSIFLAVLMAFISHITFAQAKGNYDYRASDNIHYVHPLMQHQFASLANLPGPGQVEFRIRGLTNCNADSYFAIFTMTQVGKSQREADALMGQKIDSVRNGLVKAGADAELFVDMISFLPIYETDVVKKLFSKTTYNEVPKGFELKKNLHFRYRNPAVLERLVTICAESEIYDLVRVDYFIDDMEAKKAELMTQGEAMLKVRITRHKVLVNEDFEDKDRQLGEGFAVHYPAEQYRTYITYHSTAINKMSGETKADQMTTSQFFLPRMSKEYDFVNNNSMLEPVIQIEYELAMRMSPKPKEVEKPKEVVKKEREYLLITPGGEVKVLGI